MSDLLVRLFIKNASDIKDMKVREQYGYLAGCVGVICNIFLFITKLIIGTISNSVAITVDAFNNLSDVGSSVATIIGFKLMAKPADKEHPFGHGRFEYIATLVIAAMVIYVGCKFFGTSLDRILNPEKVEFNIVGISALLISILVKMWMVVFNRNIGKRIGSKTMEATALDSMSDVICTFVVAISYIVARFSDFPLDGYIGILVSLFILYNGYKITSETISPLLGEAPDEELVSEIVSRLLSYKYIIGTHDLVVHSYGPGRCIATVHAEVPDDVGIIESHDSIDNAEREISKELGIDLVIHMDPVNTTDPKVLEVKNHINLILAQINLELSFHDLRIVRGVTHTNIIFDLVLYYDCPKAEEKSIIREIEEKVKLWNTDYNCVITVDRPYN